MTRIIVVRHGQSEANLLGIGAGQSNTQLTPLGHAQAAAVARYLVSRESITAVYSSDLDRAYETALPTANALGLTVTKDRRLREVDTGLFTGRRCDRREIEFPEYYKIMKETPSLMQYPEGEYVPDVYDRMKECICEIVDRHRGETLLIASHAGALKSFLAYGLGYSRVETAMAPPIANTAISIFEWDGEKMTPVEINSTEHLTDLDTHIEKE